MKTNSPSFLVRRNVRASKAQALAALLKLVTRHAPQARISAANDRFYARWKHDGLAMLVVAHGKAQ